MSRLHALLFPALIGLSISATACLEMSGDEAVGEATSDLLVSNWKPAVGLPTGAWRGTQVATLNGVTYAVSAGDCGGTQCFPYIDENTLRWSVQTASGTWAYKGEIPGQSSNSKVSLAPFNGFLYMVHTGGSDSSATWYSRFDPNSETWSSNSQIPAYPSYNGPPAIVAYNNLLYFIASQSNGVMWVATMTPGEGFSAPIGINHHTSTGRPSAAVLNGKLYIAHTLLAPNDTTLVYGTFDGTTWSYPLHIKNGTAADIYGREAAIATDQGVLQLVHTIGTGDSEPVYWTYFDGCNWAGAEVTLADWRTSQAPALTQGGPGLVMTTTSDDYDWFWQTLDQRNVISHTYTHPRITRPPVVPICNIVAQP